MSTSCDSRENCLSFEPQSTQGYTTTYVEASGLCTLTMELVDQSFRDGTTQDEFMLDIMFQVVRVQDGAGNCRLTDTLGKYRSLTGIYP